MIPLHKTSNVLRITLNYSAREKTVNMKAPNYLLVQLLLAT